MENKLKPCPLCNGIAEVHQRNRFEYLVKCRNTTSCGIRLPNYNYFTSEENAIKAWNTRPSESQKNKLIEEVMSNIRLCYYKNISEIYDDLCKFKQSKEGE